MGIVEPRLLHPCNRLRVGRRRVTRHRSDARDRRAQRRVNTKDTKDTTDLVEPAPQICRKPPQNMAIARSGAPLPPLIFIGSATMNVPRTGRRSRLVRFSNAGMSRPYRIWCDSYFAD